jgi:Histidine kinase-, DNA gyrase B-, and HSP90-like ATPase
MLEVIALTGSELRSNGTSLQTRLADGLPLVPGDRIQLQRVMLNPILNAVEAMSGSSETARELLIRTEQDGPDGVLVAVEDSGPGLKPDSLDRLFDPFYTTKPDGLGNGTVDLPFDHRGAWRTLVGHIKPAPRRCLSVHPTPAEGDRVLSRRPPRGDASFMASRSVASSCLALDEKTSSWVRR